MRLHVLFCTFCLLVPTDCNDVVYIGKKGPQGLTGLRGPVGVGGKPGEAENDRPQKVQHFVQAWLWSVGILHTVCVLFRLGLIPVCAAGWRTCNYGNRKPINILFSN